jgi:hypothetical protein
MVLIALESVSTIIKIWQLLFDNEHAVPEAGAPQETPQKIHDPLRAWYRGDFMFNCEHEFFRQV